MFTHLSTLQRRLPYLVGGALVLAVLWAVVVRNDDRVLASGIGITRYPNGGAMVQIPYQNDGAAGRIRIALDLNKDGAFEENEIVVVSPARPQRYWNSNYFFRDERLAGGPVRVRVAFAGANGEESIEREVRPVDDDAVIRSSDFSGVTQPELSMREGQTRERVPVAPVPTVPDSGSYRFADTPDLVQRIAECAPTAAANSLISLAREHGQDGKLPADSLTMIDELKGDMRWTPENGVLPDDFVAGKNLWAAKKGLPIKTEKVGNQNGTTTLEALARGLQAGKAAELRLAFAEPVRGGYKVVGGHLVTVVGVHAVDGKTYIDIHDPKSPSGVDTHRVEGNRLTDYELYTEGVTVMSWGFTQTWTGQDLDPMSDAEVRGIREFAGEKRRIKALHIGERFIPLEQVHVSAADLCDTSHWHANVGGTARDTQGKLFPEIFEHCGYGKTTDVPVVEIDVP
ncbi:MAG: hypothetical protein IT405_03820 [Candidatus Yanofskybacteria bacterium]|nr:hypothetical protein [Candidatus Yanofskybacteria bacterium]